MRRLAALACLLTGTAAAAGNFPVSAQAPAPTKRAMKLRLDMKAIKPIPVQRVKGVIILRAVVAGREANLLFDNGTGATIIDRTLAQEANLPLTNSGIKMNTGLSAIPTQLTAAEVRVGDALTINGQIMVADLGGMSRALGIPIAGVLGADVMAPFVIAVNPQKAWVAFALPGYMEISSKATAGGAAGAQAAAALKTKDADALKAAAYQIAARSVPTTVSFGPDFTVNATINGKAVRLKIDYGMAGAVALRSDVWQRVIPPEARSGTSASYTRADGLDATGEVGNGNLQIAGVTVKDMPIMSRTATDSIKSEGLLGLAVLASTTTVIDMPKRQLWLFPTGQEVSVSLSEKRPGNSTASE